MGMTFRELIDYAKKEEASDVHVTVGTNIALRRFGNLEIMEPAPSAEEATELIFSELSEEQIAQVKAGEVHRLFCTTFLSTIIILFIGHSFSHLPQPMHLSSSTRSLSE